ncbi:hypothetical protein [Angustibacter peucedani]
MRPVLTLRLMVVSGLLLTVAATALAGSAAAAIPTRPSGPVLSTSELPAVFGSTPVWSDVAPASVRRVAVRPVTTSRSHARPPVRAKKVAKPAPRPHLSPLQAAVARIPGYAQHRPAVWVMSTKYGNFGVTDWFHNTVYVNPRVPASLLDDVVRHEWGHVLSVRAYGGSVPATISGLDRTFGGSGLTGAERAADCVATVLGADWRHYTSCSSRAWQRSARDLLAGRRP